MFPEDLRQKWIPYSKVYLTFYVGLCHCETPYLNNVPNILFLISYKKPLS